LVSEHLSLPLKAILALVITGFLFSPTRTHGQASLPVYTDSLINGFQDWGWAAHDYANSTPVHSGTHSISVTIDSAWSGLQIYHPDFDSSGYSAVSFWVNGGSAGDQQLQLYGLLHVGSNQNASQKSMRLDSVPRNSWRQFIVALSALGIANKTNCTGFVIQDALGTIQPTFYVDDIELLPAPPPNVVHLQVDATQPVRRVDFRHFGVNTAIWDSNFDTPETVSLLEEMGTRLLRGPGGSLSDEYHWSTDTSLSNTWLWATSFGQFARVATNIGAQAILTVNYGTGSPNEAAAWVAYANALATSPVSLGVDASGRDWQTAGYWASLRASAPLAHDDGRNFLRLGREAPLAFRYWEIGNECYGTWETDSNSRAHDAYTYASNARQFIEQMKAVDTTIQVGVVAAPGEETYANGYADHPALNPLTGQMHHGWTPVLLATLKSLGVTPDFLIHHRYPEYTDKNSPAGGDSDSFLLQCSTQWAIDAVDLRQQIRDYFGANGSNIELFCTENNSDAGAQGKQSTSLVNGLYYADSLAALFQTEFNSFIWWDLRNATDTSGWFDSSLYGWRTYGDLGMINGLQTRHPTFYAAKLMRDFAQPGDTILHASSDYTLLSVYAGRGANGDVNVLVLNKDPASTLAGQINLNSFAPETAALVHSYGIAQDEAARTNAAPAAQDIATNTFTGVAASFERVFPPLSMTLITLTPAGPHLSVAPPGMPGGVLLLQLQGQPGSRYLLQSSTDLVAWSTISTNVLVNSSLTFTNLPAAGTAVTFWRAIQPP
jgi:hypothetical protein